ncbi:MAG: hypothetical protein CEE38_08695 [Planctomycetes bacterium B3_Pla]|nr:MAG: hypothetical protein CEE38_08695 [Planctomycetes bacterium B3_Pla]
MIRKLKTLFVVVSAGALIYFISLVNISAAEDNEIDSEREFADVTISVEASVVRVSVRVFEEIAD